MVVADTDTRPVPSGSVNEAGWQAVHSGGAYDRPALAEPGISSVLRGRDRFLIAAFVLVNIIVVIVVVRVTAEDEDKKPKVRIPPVGRVVENTAIGAEIRRPKGWKVSSKGRQIIMRSPDSSTIMSISQPPGAKNGLNVVRTSIAALRQNYRQVSTRRLKGKIAGLPTTSRVVSATNRRRVRLNILVAAPQGRTRAWLVQVFSGPGARSRRLPEAQVSLASLKLRG
jgi:hypothetical protein